MNWLDLFGDDNRIEVGFSDPDFYALDSRCEDDKSVIAPYIGMMPDESETEHGSPLKF
jgi:hypothetical protein